jgi:hypothetical protein
MSRAAAFQKKNGPYDDEVRQQVKKNSENGLLVARSVAC